MKRIHSFCILACMSLFMMAKPLPVEVETDTAKVTGEQEDSIYVALLTCDPGWDAYKLFGHTAIRIRVNDADSLDFSFNYGIFDFQSENFIYRFVKGETDYVLAAEPMDRFLSRYSAEGIAVMEQPLNLSKAQRKDLLEKLLVNALPENKTYRYNFLYDNCTTRARDMIERVVGKGLKVERKPLDTTYREILHRFTERTPWTAFGIDMLLGSEVDRKVTASTQQFIPSIYMADADSTTILVAVADSIRVLGENGDSIWIAHEGKTRQPLVSGTRIYAPAGAPQTGANFPLSPTTFFWLLFAVACLLSFLDLRRRVLSIWFDICLFTAQGIAGLLISFLFFFSEHPAVGSNWLVIGFNPLVFLMIVDVLMIKKKHRPLIGRKKYNGKFTDWLEFVNLAGLLCIFLLYWLPIQWLHPAMLPLVLTLLLRSLVRINYNCNIRRYY